MTRHAPYLIAAIIGGAAGWIAAGQFAAHGGMSDAVRIAASGVLLLLAGLVGFQIARRLGAGRGQP